MKSIFSSFSHLFFHLSSDLVLASLQQGQLRQKAFNRIHDSSVVAREHQGAEQFTILPRTSQRDIGRVALSTKSIDNLILNELLNLSCKCAAVRDDVASIRIDKCTMALTHNFACAGDSFVDIGFPASNCAVVGPSKASRVWVSHELSAGLGRHRHHSRQRVARWAALQDARRSTKRTLKLLRCRPPRRRDIGHCPHRNLSSLEGRRVSRSYFLDPHGAKSPGSH